MSAQQFAHSQSRDNLTPHNYFSTADMARKSQQRTGGIMLVPSSPRLALTAQAPQDVRQRFGLRLRDLRRSRHMTQLRMAEKFGIDRSFISDVEHGKKSISLPMLEVIALGLKLSLSDLLRDL